jgi:hypothetical protein
VFALGIIMLEFLLYIELAGRQDESLLTTEFLELEMTRTQTPAERCASLVSYLLHIGFGYVASHLLPLFTREITIFFVFIIVIIIARKTSTQAKHCCTSTRMDRRSTWRTSSRATPPIPESPLLKHSLTPS